MNATTTITTSERAETSKGSHDTQAEAAAADPRKMSRAELEALGHGQPILKAVRQNCIDCSGGSSAEVARCAHMKCPLWPFKMGTNPLNRRTLTDEQKAAAAERLRRARQGAGANAADTRLPVTSALLSKGNAKGEGSAGVMPPEGPILPKSLAG